MTMGVGRFAILMTLAGLIAAPALAQQAAPPPVHMQQPREIRPDASPWRDPRELRTQQPSDPCDAKRGRIIAEPDYAPGGAFTLMQWPKPRPLNPREGIGRLCPASPAS
jgi:hypothetical protein